LINTEKFKKRVELHGIEILNEALKEKKGAVLFSAHMGNFELGGCRIAVEGVKIVGIGLERPFKKTGIFRHLHCIVENLDTFIFPLLTLPRLCDSFVSKDVFIEESQVRS